MEAFNHPPGNGILISTWGTKTAKKAEKSQITRFFLRKVFTFVKGCRIYE